ncbi:MAG: DUF6782 family putative metallopeptidase [Geminicoccaceae bacterium]
MLDSLRLQVLACLSACVLAAASGRAADLEAKTVATGSSSPATPAVERDRGAEIDALLEPWRRIRVAHLIPDHAQTCLPVAIRLPATPAQRELTASLDLVAQSALGAWLIERASSRRVLICHDPNTHLAAYYRSQVRLIGVLTRLPEPAKIMFLAHELAHVPQHPDFSNDRRFGPKAMLLMHRVREATAEALATRVLWQLRRRGYLEPWDYKLPTTYGDIAHAFAQTIGDRGGDASELLATRAAFDQWFERAGRVQQYDDHMLDHLERALRDRPAPAGPRRSLSDGFLRNIGWHAGATFLPAGTGRLLTDPYYAGRLSADNAIRLDAILERAMRPPKVMLEDREPFR